MHAKLLAARKLVGLDYKALRVYYIERLRNCSYLGGYERNLHDILYFIQPNAINAKLLLVDVDFCFVLVDVGKSFLIP